MTINVTDVEEMEVVTPESLLDRYDADDSGVVELGEAIQGRMVDYINGKYHKARSG